jgi:chaperonin cofactor prefoldin
MTFIIRRLKVPALLLFLLLVIGLACVGNLCAQLKKDQVDFEVLTTVTAEKGYNCCLWNMAEKHLGDYRQWKCIAELNKIPNERKISVGTVVYIPAKCKKGYVEKPAEKPAAVNELQAKLDDCMAKLKACEDEKEKLAKALDECKKAAKMMGDMDALKKCEAERNELAEALENCKKKGEPNKKMRGLKQELEECDAKMQRLTRAMKDKDATIDELEAKLRRARAEAGDQEAAMGRVREKERRISELEKQLQECRERPEGERGREKPVAGERPPKPVKGECKSSRSFVAAMAIALVGSIVWIGTSASD